MVRAPQQSSTLRRLCVLLSLVFLVYAVLLTTRSHAGFPQTRDTHTRWPWLGDKPVGEDGFYMLTVARHMAREHRIVYNYAQPATGFQPLTTFLWAGIAVLNVHFGGNDWTFVRLVLLFQCLLFLVFVWLLAGFAAKLASPERRSLVFFFAFCLTLLDFSAFRLFTYGLESGPYLTCLALCVLVWRRLVLAGGRRWPWVILLGLCAGLTGLARIDFGIVLAVVLLVMWLRRELTLAQMLLCGLLALVIVSPWFFYVHGVTGGWLPSSGKAEGSLIGLHSLSRLFGAWTALLVQVVPWSFANASAALRHFAEACLFALVLWAGLTRHRWRRSLSPQAVRIVLPWAIGLGSLLIVYPIFFWPDWFYVRYFSPLLIVWIPLLALFLAEQPWLRRFPLVAGAVLLAIFAAEDFTSLHTGHIATNLIVTAGYIHDVYPHARVGAFQSGAIGFFDGNVVNLDGKMNDDALRADATHHLDNYLDRSHITVLTDWEQLIRYHLPANYLAAKWQPCPRPMPIPDSICLVRRKP